MRDDVRIELRIHADNLPLAGKALAEIERLRAALVDVIAASDFQPCHHAKIAARALGRHMPEPVRVCQHGAKPDESCPECIGAPSDNPDNEIASAYPTTGDSNG